MTRLLQPLYVIVNKNTIEDVNGLTNGEKLTCKDSAKALAPLFQKYVDGVKALEA
jgi:hypothetical protein